MAATDCETPGIPEIKVTEPVVTEDKVEKPERPPAPPVDPEPSAAEVLAGIPEGNYKVVTFAADLTGRKSFDEICQIAAYINDEKVYSQYVMPFCNVSLGSTRNHGIKVFVLFGKYRVLRSTRNMKTLKTKSIYSTIHEFLDWLKEMKGSSDGIILAYHDHKMGNIPFFLRKAVQEYKLTEEYAEIVKGVINCAKPLPPLKDEVKGEGEKVKEKEKGGRARSNSLRALLRQSFDMDAEKLQQQLQSARHRARLTQTLHAKFLKSEGPLCFNDLKAALLAEEDGVAKD